MKEVKKEIVKRYKGNPILTKDDAPFPCSGIYNSGITKYKGKYLMLCRVETVALVDCFMVATSDDGYNFKLREQPIEMPDSEELKMFANEMIYDPRITQIGDIYYICFAAHSCYGVRIAIISTRNFEKFDLVSLASEPNNRNAVLFPEKINGLYARLDRPTEDIWLSYSPDMVYWGNSRLVTRRGPDAWNKQKIGAGAVPIKTKQGWLEIWHGVHVMCAAQYVYHLGVMLLDLKDPSKVIARAKGPILSPMENYERVGLTQNVVFTAGAVVEDDGEVKIYYGGADTVQCVGTATIDDLLWACHNW